MNSSVTNTLLALLLALRELKAPLTTDEQAVLQNVGQQLALDPEDWEYIKEGLIALIEANAALNHLFKLNKAKLAATPAEKPPTDSYGGQNHYSGFQLGAIQILRRGTIVSCPSL